jgi:hypothetical protein
MGLGATDLDDYEPPGARVADWLEPEVSPAEDRYARIAEIAALTGGEVG